MKRIFLINTIVVLVCLAFSSIAQNANKPHTIRISGGVHDSYGPYKNDRVPFGIWNTENHDLAFQLQYMKYANEFMDFGVNVTAADTKNLYDDGFSNTGAGQVINNGSSLDLDLITRFKFYNGNDFKENSFIKPYVYTGVSGSYISALETKKNVKNGLGGNIPLGIGFKFGKGDRLNFDLNGALRIGLFNKTPTRWEYQTGFSFNFGEPVNKAPKEDIVMPPPPVDVDSDGDGIIDRLDDCPNEKGIARLQGCPEADRDQDGVADDIDNCPDEAGDLANKGCPAPADTDGDGIADDEDECPTVAGVASLNGCPKPVDSDGDGVADDVDNCPSVPGVPELDGCPRVIDTDNDGVADSDDDCPTVPGLVELRGCPRPTTPSTTVVEQLNFIARSVFFKFNSAELHTDSRAQLDAIADIMRDYPSAQFVVEGHTDSVGNAEYNKTLSGKRAASVVNYLVGKGIPASNLTSVGVGEEQPIASNDTEEGRQQNRRVVISLK